MMSSHPLTDYEQEILDHVEEFGSYVTTVTADPAFSYSAGFECSFNRPEAIVSGLGYGVMVSMINRLGDQYRDGFAPINGQRATGILNGFDVVIRDIPTERITRDFFNSAIWLNRQIAGQPLTRAVQIFWPCDQTGLFPWETGCPNDVIERQPPLYETSIH